MEYRIDGEALRRFCEAACRKYGYSPEDAAITAEVLTETEMLGIHSHGVKNLWNYLRKTEAGGIRPHAVPETLREGPGWALMDAGFGIGMVSAYRAMEKAMEKAAQCGVAIVTVRNGTHFGAAGFYARMAAKKGLIGVAMGNTEPNMAIPGGRGREIGNSPFAIAFPQQSDDPLCLDIAMSTVAALKVEKARDSGSPIPDTWIVDRDGFPSTDPRDYFDGGAAQPMAGHKGYGLAMAVEILTGVMSGGAMLHEMTSWLWDLAAPNRVSFCFLAIDPAKFLGRDAFARRLAEYTDALHRTPVRRDCAGILVPGEPERNCRCRAAANGIALPQDVADSLMQAAAQTGITLLLKERENLP